MNSSMKLAHLWCPGSGNVLGRLLHLLVSCIVIGSLLYIYMTQGKVKQDALTIKEDSAFLIEDKEQMPIISTANIKLPLHPYLNKTCYKYKDLEATNICCKYRTYTREDLHTCGSKESARIKSMDVPREYYSDWMFYGNSRIRKLFFQLQGIFSGTPVDELNIDKDRKHYYVNKTASFQMRQIMDSHFINLPKRVRLWLNNSQERPTRLHIGSGVNFMHMKDFRNQSIGATEFQNVIDKLVPLLQKLSEFIPVSWWEIERVLKPQVYPELQKVFAESTIDLYNDMLRKALQGTDITQMNAHIPLGRLFIESCKKHYVQDYIRCDSHVHQGSRATRQYAMMFLNHACNSYLETGQLNHNYCA